MPYSITTKDNITIQNIPDDVAPDSQALKDRVAAIRAQGVQRQPEAPPMGIGERIAEAVTGSRRRVEETEALPDWGSMPELNEFSAEAAKTGLGTLFSNPAETVQVIKSNYPGVQVRQDEKGNFILKSSIDQKEYAIKPGFRLSDVPRAAGGVAAFTPAGRAATLPGMAVAAGATQAGIEASQAATGGTFNPEDVGIAAVTAPILPAAVGGVKAVAKPTRDAINRALGRPVAAPPPPPPPSAPPVNPAAQPTVPLDAAELTQTARSAAGGGIGSSRAAQVLAEQASPSAKTVEAAKRLGIDDYLQPEHVTTSQAYRELAEAVKSIPGSVGRQESVRGLNEVAKRADDLIVEIGGTRDLSQLSGGLRDRMQNVVRELETKADDAYDALRNAIPAKTEAPAPSVLEFIKNHADEIGGVKNLSQQEKSILGRLEPKDGSTPTYALLDQVRKDVGAAMRGNRGPFKDAEEGMLKKLYGLITKDQEAVVTSLGQQDAWNAAKALVSVRKGVEDDMVSLFGKNLDQSIVSKLATSVKDLPKGDVDKFVKMIQSVPEDMRQTVTASGLASAFQKSASRGEINFGNYAQWYEGLLRNKRAHTAIMANLPREARKSLSDLYRVSKGISLSSRERITTGRIQAIQQEFQAADSFVGRLYELAGSAAPTAAAEGAASALGVPGAGIASGIASALTKGKKPNPMRAVDEFLASPEFIAGARAAGTGQTQAAARQIARSQAFKKFAKQVNRPELSDPVKWLNQALTYTAPKQDDSPQQSD